MARQTSSGNIFSHLALARLLAAVLLSTGLAGESACAEDAVLKTYRRQLSMAREDVIRMLEASVQKDPSNVDHWVALVHSLAVNGEPHFADRAARLALKSHPTNLQLLVARAKVLDKPAAWDQLESLANLPGQRERAEMLQELLSVDLLYAYGQMRPAPAQARLRAEWAERLLKTGNHARVPKLVEQGLAINPQEPRLHALVPFMLVLSDRFDEALKEQSRRNFPQTPAGQLICLADCLLTKKQPQMAIDSFGGKTPTKTDQRRILALAHAAAGEYEMAEKLIGKTAVDDLLRLRWDLERGREKAVRERVPQLLARHCTRGVGSWAAPRYAAFGGTLGAEYREAIRWLERQFPLKQTAIYQAFGLSDPQKVFREPWWPSADVRLSSRRFITWLRAAIPTAKEEHRRAMRRELAKLLAQQREVEEATQVLAVNAVLPNTPSSLENGDINPDAVRWSLLRRRIAAEKLHRDAPWSLVRARQLLAEIQCKKWNSSRIGASPWREPQDVVSDLRKLPAGILAAVSDDLQPEVFSSDDRTHLIAVVREWAELEDIPVLISTLRKTVRKDGKQRAESDRRSEEALHLCLQQITGTDGPQESGMPRALFWLRWWRGNALRIVSSQ